MSSVYLKDVVSMKTIAVGEGLQVKKVFHDGCEQYVYFLGFDYDPHKRKVQYDRKSGNPYFTFNGIKRYINSFLRVTNYCCGGYCYGKEKYSM